MSKPHRPRPSPAPKKQKRRTQEDHPPPEDDFGGGDFASPEISPPTEDDRPLE